MCVQLTDSRFVIIGACLFMVLNAWMSYLLEEYTDVSELEKGRLPAS
jgi:hypothetical protein